MRTTKRSIFLDDVRNPGDVYQYTKEGIFLRNDWCIVRNYEQFTGSILEKGLPRIISFDHDLGMNTT